MSESMSHISEPWRIAGLALPNRVAQAPMAGISIRAFRLQARRFGAGLAWSEMVSSYGIHYANARTLAMLELVEAERPLAVQIFGSSPEVMARAAAAAEAAGCDLVDINMGCPVRKVVKTGAGVALMEDEALAEAVVRAVRAAVAVPVAVKIRSGPRSRVTAVGFALKMEHAGADVISIHPRLGSQGRSGRADHSVTRDVAARLEAPVIASGDIGSAREAAALLGRTGCAAVMVGRAALGNPWLFSDILAGRDTEPRPLEETLSELERFSRDVEAEMGTARAVRFMRKFYGWYLAAYRPNEQLRRSLREAESLAGAVRLARAGLGAAQD